MKGGSAGKDAAARIQALDEVSFQIQPGMVVGVLGPNGSGKSTLFRVLATLLRPMGGTARVFGLDVLTQPDQVRQQLGVVFQAPAVDRMLTARENLIHQAALYGLSRRGLPARVDELLERFELTERSGHPVGTLSGGFQRRVELAKAMLHRPRVLLMDEPSASIDPAARQRMWKHLRAMSDQQGLTVFLTTHLLDEAERCDHLLMMDHGRLIAEGTPDQIKQHAGPTVLTLRAEQPRGQAVDRQADASTAVMEQIQKLSEAHSRPWPAEISSGQITVRHPQASILAGELLAAMPEAVAQMHLGRPTLEDAFTALTGRRLTEPAEDPTGHVE